MLDTKFDGRDTERVELGVFLIRRIVPAFLGLREELDTTGFEVLERHNRHAWWWFRKGWKLDERWILHKRLNGVGSGGFRNEHEGLDVFSIEGVCCRSIESARYSVIRMIFADQMVGELDNLYHNRCDPAAKSGLLQAWITTFLIGTLELPLSVDNR